MKDKKQTYEAPETVAWKLTMERELLTLSTEGIQSSRENYGNAVEEEW